MKIDTENGLSLYALTGDIKDVNTLMVNRAELRYYLPWRVKLRICWRNWQRFRRWRLNM